LLIDDLRKWEDILYLQTVDEYLISRSYKEGIKRLEESRWDVLYLDHDLGEDKTGYDVMCWLEEHPEFLPGDIFFVSANPVGRQRMQQVKEKLYKKET